MMDFGGGGGGKKVYIGRRLFQAMPMGKGRMKAKQ